MVTRQTAQALPVAPQAGMCTQPVVKPSGRELETEALSLVSAPPSTFLPKYRKLGSPGVLVRYFLLHILVCSPVTNSVSSVMAQVSPLPAGVIELLGDLIRKFV